MLITSIDSEITSELMNRFCCLPFANCLERNYIDCLFGIVSFCNGFIHLHLAIVVTDGYQNRPGSTERESRLAKEAGIEIFTVGVTSNINRTELNLIASNPSNVYVVQVC